jgi:hypothetical protein
MDLPDFNETDPDVKLGVTISNGNSTTALKTV